METNELALFLRAAEMGNITRAAAELGYTQSAASHVLRKLERTLGVTLFLRDNTGVRLTEEGRQLRPEAERLVADEKALLRVAAQLHGTVSGTVRIGCISSISIRWMPALREGFTRRYPQVALRLTDGAYEEIEDWISEKKVDVGFLSSTTTKDFRLIPLLEDPMLAVLPKGHPLCGLSEIPPAALRGQQLLIPAEGLRYDLGDILRRAGMEGEADSIVSDYAALSLVRQGCGITILPRLLLDEAGRHGTEVRHIAGEPKRVICLASLAHQSMSPAAAAFCRYVQEWTAENGQ